MDELTAKRTAKRTAGELGLAPKACICDPMDLAALGHMLNCPCFKPRILPPVGME